MRVCFTVPAPGHYGDTATVVSSHNAVDAARRFIGARRDLVIRMGDLRPGATWHRSSEAIYPLAASGIPHHASRLENVAAAIVRVHPDNIATTGADRADRAARHRLATALREAQRAGVDEATRIRVERTTLIALAQLAREAGR